MATLIGRHEGRQGSLEMGGWQILQAIDPEVHSLRGPGPQDPDPSTFPWLLLTEIVVM